MLNRIISFFQNTVAEFKKVTWPTKPHTVKSTIVVLSITAIMALFLGAVNSGLIQGIQVLIR